MYKLLEYFNLGYSNNECHTNCPVFCAENEILCPGSIDSYTGNYPFFHPSLLQ